MEFFTPILKGKEEDNECVLQKKNKEKYSSVTDQFQYIYK